MSKYRSVPNYKLTDNFWLYEFIEAHPTKSEVFIRQNWEHIDEFKRNYSYERNAEFLQDLRKQVNDRWQAENGSREIGLALTSAFRNSTWEAARGRRGEHRRTAFDIQPTNINLPKGGVNLQLGARILAWLYDEVLKDHDGGVAIRRPEYNKGVISKMGFVHCDYGVKRRWNY